MAMSTTEHHATRGGIFSSDSGKFDFTLEKGNSFALCPISPLIGKVAASTHGHTSSKPIRAALLEKQPNHDHHCKRDPEKRVVSEVLHEFLHGSLAVVNPSMAICYRELCGDDTPASEPVSCQLPICPRTGGY